MQLNIVEEIVLGLIKSYTVKDLQYAVDREINLSGALQSFTPGYVAFARIVGAIYRRDEDNLTYENVLGWLQYSRPDLYELIDNSQVTRNWFRKQLKEIKNLIWGDGL